MNILLVEDDDDLGEMLVEHLRSLSLNVILFKNAESAIKLLTKKNEKPIDLVITNNKLLGISGVELLLYLRGMNISYPPFIFLTGNPYNIPEEVLIIGAIAIIDKEGSLDRIEDLLISLRINKPLS